MRAVRPACVVVIALSLAVPLGGIGGASPPGSVPSSSVDSLLDGFVRTLPPAPSAGSLSGPDEVGPALRWARVLPRVTAAAPSGTVARPPAAPARREAGLRSRATALIVQDFLWPARGAITSLFGWRRTRHHDGIDIAAPYGTPIYAARAGRVTFAGWFGGYGRAVIVDHGDRMTTLYGHASRLLVRTGDEVNAGQEIAKVGSSGLSQGPHLHFEIRVNGRPIDPLVRADPARPAAAGPAPWPVALRPSTVQAAAGPQPARGGRYYVQVGAYRVAENAEAMAAGMRRAGFSAVVIRVSDLYLVRLGGYPDRDSSDRTVADLRRLGFEAFVTR